MMASEETDLPQPDSPDDGDDLAAIDRVGNALDGVNGAARGLEPHVQVAHL